MVVTTALDTTDIWRALEAVKDPEIPIISVVDLGIVTDVSLDADNKVTVSMTPTFTGCPALELIKTRLREAVVALGFNSVEVIVDRSVTWTSNRVTAKGKDQLERFGLSSPAYHSGDITPELVEYARCPHCGSENTSLRSPFGSALCRSIHICYDCKQSFEKFKEV
jgi:ring-1,2-phenylacetyl-CoA epoxidase subunit PaaD